ncbi:MAG: esterase family protein [Treponema sp.]|jgi:enterochelin esterase-like enzyme|nr:esterase family protein [Treponema sp.]
MSENSKEAELVKTSYYSTVCEKDKNVIILLPPNYSPEKKYPVLYILHGYFQDETSLAGSLSEGNSKTITNLILAGKAKEMITVFPFIYSSKTKNQCSSISDPHDWDAYDNFVNDLTIDLMAWLKKNFSILEGRENTAITGFSMGGREALAIGLAHPELFAYIGAIAPAPGLTPNYMHPGQFKEIDVKFEKHLEPKLLQICVGSKDDVVTNFPESYHKIFKKNKINHEWWIVDGSDHGDPAITDGITKFCKRIFK